MMVAMQLHASAELFLVGAVLSIVLGGPITLLAGTLLRLGGRQSSRMRFVVWYITLLAILLVPLGSWVVNSSHSANTYSSNPSHSLFTIPAWWAVAVFGLWATLAAIAIFRLTLGLAKLRRLRRSCAVVDRTSLDPILQNTVQELSCGRPVEVCVSQELSVPTAIGFFKPLVILPAWTLHELSPSELRPVLLHELAHVARWDDWTNLLQKVIQALLFFHPAVWWIEKRISLEREMACDDVVLAHTESPRAYAESLLTVAEKSFGRRGLSLAQAAVNRVRQTSLRITQILQTKRPANVNVWKPASLVLAASALMSFAALPRLPQFVSFREPATVPVASVAVAVPAIKSGPPVELASVKAPRHIVNKTSIKISATQASARRKTQTFPPSEVIQAKFNDREVAARAPNINSVNARELRVVQRTYIVFRPGQDLDAPELLTIRVWQLTVFHCNPPAEALPAKKV